jgi:hypothetical protein
LQQSDNTIEDTQHRKHLLTQCTQHKFDARYMTPTRGTQVFVSNNLISEYKRVIKKLKGRTQGQEWKTLTQISVWRPAMSRAPIS